MEGLAKAARHTSATTGHASFLGNHVRSATENVSIPEPKRADPYFGFSMPLHLSTDMNKLQSIYVITSGADCGLIKVGVANDVQRRLLELSAGNPHGLSLLASRQIERVMAFQVERRAHQHFAAESVGREWFRVSADDALEVIDRLSRRARSALRYFKRVHGIAGR